MKRKKIELAKALRDDFQVKGKPISSCFVLDPYGEVNFRTMTKGQAEHLVAMGFPFLARKQ
jgi:hypothetical protein